MMDLCHKVTYYVRGFLHDIRWSFATGIAAAADAWRDFRRMRAGCNPNELPF